MSCSEEFGRRYDEWSAPMTADVGFYVELARRADGPLVELAAGDRHRLLAGDARARTCPCDRGGRGARPARGRHARPRPRRAGGPDLLPPPGSPPPAHLGRPSPPVRARRRLAPSGRAVRLER